MDDYSDLPDGRIMGIAGLMKKGSEEEEENCFLPFDLWGIGRGLKEGSMTQWKVSRDIRLSKVTPVETTKLAICIYSLSLYATRDHSRFTS